MFRSQRKEHRRTHRHVSEISSLILWNYSYVTSINWIETHYSAIRGNEVAKSNKPDDAESRQSTYEYLPLRFNFYLSNYCFMQFSFMWFHIFSLQHWLLRIGKTGMDFSTSRICSKSRATSGISRYPNPRTASRVNRHSNTWTTSSKLKKIARERNILLG